MEVRSTAALSDEERTALFDRDAGIAAIRDDAAAIVERVRTEGDDALRAFADEYDDHPLERIDITDEADRAVDRIDVDLRAAIETAHTNVRAFHEQQVPADDRTRAASPGRRELGRRFRPVDRAGAYVPGGSAAYPSSAIMTVTPARVAGVDHVAITTPPGPAPSTLAAAAIAGADAVYAAGGAQGIGALAYGTETVDPVDIVVGPGNRWVTAAKAAVRNDVAIDGLAGPSEILVLADDTADPALVAADLVAQAEHDERASAVAVTDDRSTADAIAAAVESRVPNRERADTIQAALTHGASGVFHAPTMDAATAFAERYAPEHLSIQAADDEALLERIDSAGSVFLGPLTPVAAGDYATGTNHVLPTGGAARRTGGLSVETFLRATTVQRLDREALADLRDPVERLARAEGLEAHAASIRERFEEQGDGSTDGPR